MVDLSTTYLGLKLRSPLVASASPISEHLDNIRQMEDSGTSAIVLYSLFEEQLTLEQRELHYHLTQGTESFAEALTYFPDPDDYKVGPDGYLEHIRKAKEAVDIPIIASLNGATPGGWTEFAAKMAQAGADALELNVYSIPTDMDKTAAEVEDELIQIVKSVCETVSIPVSVKLSPFYSNMANVAKRLDGAGADGLVLFNRFYQPDIDLEALEVRPNVVLSTSSELRLRLRWVAILYGRIQADLAATGGVHRAADVIKMVMTGAAATMMTAALIQHGIKYVKFLEDDLRSWMIEHEYESITQMRGSLSQKNAGDASAFERAQYMRAIQSLPAEYR